MNDFEEKLDYAVAVTDWLLDHAEDHLERDELEQALNYIYIAGSILQTQNRDLVSLRVERNLQRISNRLADRGLIQRDVPVRSGRPERCLHVITEALPAGGLTAMASRWIANDTGGRVHSVALLSQEVPIPGALQSAVERSGGVIHSAPVAQTLVERACWLRTLAESDANFVILHVELADVVCGAAFGAPGGPPVLVVNHAAHLYWSGASIADLVVNCRGSELELLWTRHYRGVDQGRCAVVPIPLQDNTVAETDGSPKQARKQELLARLGVAAGTIVVVTVGSAFKFLPIPNLNFLQTWEEFLSINSNVALLVIGFIGDKRWKEASAQVKNRIVTLGTMQHEELLKILDASDLYAEAFPFGTTTSLLEAGLNGLPVSVGPAECAPPYATDGVALDNIMHRPESVGDYKAYMSTLCQDPCARATLGQRVQASIRAHHTGRGWNDYLDKAVASLPPLHRPHLSITPNRTPKSVHEIWGVLSAHWNVRYENVLETAVRRALDAKLPIRVTARVKQDCIRYRRLRRGHTIPGPLLELSLNHLLPLLPASYRSNAFRPVAYLLKGALLDRLVQKLKLMIGIAESAHSPYQEYWSMREQAGAKDDRP